ncbi:MAG: hypothetical protein HYW50_00025 [Candidatus Diapherotrites archaeon]|nr:hypothetical protein [Candidatus Diapherotrites archaeon]
MPPRPRKKAVKDRQIERRRNRPNYTRARTFELPDPFFGMSGGTHTAREEYFGLTNSRAQRGFKKGTIGASTLVENIAGKRGTKRTFVKTDGKTGKRRILARAKFENPVPKGFSEFKDRRLRPHDYKSKTSKKQSKK